MKRTFSIFLFLALTACGGHFNGAEDSIAVEDTHPISVTPDVASLEIPVMPGQKRMNAEDLADLGTFIGEFKMRGHSLMQVSLPRGSRNASSAQSVYNEIRSEFSKRGLSGAYFETSVYQASFEEDSAPVILSFTRYLAETKKCGDWSQNMVKTKGNKPHPNFGCAYQNNLAAMLEDPHDLVEPRGMTPSDPERRAVVFDHYRKGEVTAAERSGDESAKTSDATPE